MDGLAQAQAHLRMTRRPPSRRRLFFVASSNPERWIFSNMKRIVLAPLLATSLALAPTFVEGQTTCAGPVAQITSPPPGSTLPAGAVTFAWCHASGDYFLDIESVPGAGDIFFAFPVGVESVTLGPACAPTPPIGCIPSKGETIYVTLWTNTASSGRKNYVAAPTLTYTAAKPNPRRRPPRAIPFRASP
jgi:hypothetical protein